MRFDSFVFPVFYLAVLALYWSARSVRRQNAVVLGASYLFYGWWDWRFLLLIYISTIVDFVVGKRLEATGKPGARKRLVLTSIVTNLGILGVFKYFDFFVTSAVDALEGLGVGANAPLLRVILPVGISFYTFQTLGYTIDVFRRKQRAERSLLNFACYVAFFPQLVAGPIERASRLLPQFSVPRTLDESRFRSGLTLLTFGLVKKVAIADNMAPMVDYVYGLPAGEASAPLIVAGTLAFAFQIYADFSGYSDIARGTARLMGFELCVNFDKPYVAMSPSDFWRRWHISLSQWLRDYLYIPLGGNRSDEVRTYRNLMATMVLGGLWHGAAWNFVVWGFYHGALLCVYRVARFDHWIRERGRLTRVVAAAIFFVFTLYGWLLFRATAPGQVEGFTLALFGGWGQMAVAGAILGVVMYFAMPLVAHHALSSGLGGEKWEPRNPWAWRTAILAVIVYGALHTRASETAFIYFQF